MNFRLVSLVVATGLAALGTFCGASSSPSALVSSGSQQPVEAQPHHQQQQQPQQAPIVGVASDARQARSLASLSGSANMIENGSSSGKSKLEIEKRQLQEFLTTKNIFKSLVKLLFGSSDEINATSRNVISILGKALDVLKSKFGPKSRSGSGRTVRDSAEDAASAGVSMLQGYVKSLLASDGQCAKRYLCQASREAANESRDLGYIIASVGGYATSYLLDANRPKDAEFKSLYEASMRGRSMKHDECAKIYDGCTE